MLLRQILNSFKIRRCDDTESELWFGVDYQGLWQNRKFIFLRWERNLFVTKERQVYCLWKSVRRLNLGVGKGVDARHMGTLTFEIDLVPQKSKNPRVWIVFTEDVSTYPSLTPVRMQGRYS
jgi:hypothetical protein